MYLHLGGEIVVAIAEVVAILDMRLLDHAEVNREFIDRALNDKRVRGEGLTPGCKALVVTRDAVFTSGISAPTLARRMAQVKQGVIAWEAEK